MSTPGPHCWCSISGRLLGVGHWKGAYIGNFPLLPFWVSIAPTVLTSVLDKFVFSDRVPQFKNMAVQRQLGSKCGLKFGIFCPPCKKGATWVECLWIFYEFSQGLRYWYSIARSVLGRFSTIMSVVKKRKKESTAAKYLGLMDRED